MAGYFQQSDFGVDMPLVKRPRQSSLPRPSDRDSGPAPKSSRKKKPDEKSEAFPVLFYGGREIEKTEKSKFERLAHEELYREMMGKVPSGKASNADIRREIEGAGGPVNIKLVVLRIDEDRVGSFSGHMRDLEKFLGESRKRFLTDAITELKDLTGIKSELGDAVSKAKFKLCISLAKAQQQTEFFDDDHTAALDDLRNDEKLKWLFGSVEKALSNDRSDDRAEGKLFYGGNPTNRTRDRGRDGLG